MLEALGERISPETIVVEECPSSRVPWPGFEEIDLAATARSLGCPAQRIETRDDLVATLDDALDRRDEPLLLDVRVA